jgi:hypothetical protein
MGKLCITNWRLEGHITGILIILTYLLTYSMGQSPWEANRFAASQEILRIVWNTKVHYRIYKWPPPVPIPSQLNPVHTLTSHFLKTHLNIIPPTKSGSPQWFLSLMFPRQNPAHASRPHTRYMPLPPHSFRSLLSYMIDFPLRFIYQQPKYPHKLAYLTHVMFY